MSDTARCPTCGWDGDDLTAAVVLMREENVALQARMKKLERAAAAAKLHLSMWCEINHRPIPEGYPDVSNMTMGTLWTVLTDSLEALDAAEEAG